MPIDNRLKMLSTGVKSPIGLKIHGPDLQTLASLANQASLILQQQVPGTAGAYPERAFGAYYLDVNVNRQSAARYGLTTGDVQDVISTAIGGMKVSTAVDALARYPIDLRYARDLRDDPSSLAQVLVSLPRASGSNSPRPTRPIPNPNPGPPMIRSEGGQPETHVYVVPNGNPNDYLADAQQIISQKLPLPPGYTLSWSGEFEQIQENQHSFASKWADPSRLLIIAILLYLATASLFRGRRRHARRPLPSLVGARSGSSGSSAATSPGLPSGSVNIIALAGL